MANVRIRTKNIPFRMTAQCASHARTDVAVRDVAVTVDEPLVRGGTNQGLAPTELALASLLGCTNVILNMCAKKAGLEVDALDLALDAELDPRGVMLLEEVDAPFPKVRLTINLQAKGSQEALGQVKRNLRRFCPVSKLFSSSGSELIEDWQVELT